LLQLGREMRELKKCLKVFNTYDKIPFKVATFIYLSSHLLFQILQRRSPFSRRWFRKEGGRQVAHLAASTRGQNNGGVAAPKM